jgi:monoamine oxidase
MQRRQFIKNTILTAGGGLVLSNCTSSNNLTPDNVPEFDGKVAIIGAGAAGLYAGFLLKQKNVEFTIFEASDVIGGRVRALKGFADYDVELGAEEIHGKKSIWYDTVKAANPTFVDDSKNVDYYQIGTGFKSEDLWKTDADFNSAINLTSQATSYVGTDITLQQFMDNNRLPARVQHITNAQIANEYGGAANKLSVKGITEEAQIWSAGNENIMIGGKTFLAIMQDKFKDVIPKVVLNKPITGIDYSSQNVLLQDASGNKLPFDKVIITVPLTILQANGIVFTPALPIAKTTALTKIGMASGIKIVMNFSKAFWAANTSSIYGTGTVPEFWVSSNGRSTQNFVLTAFITGSKADTLAAKGTNIISTVMAELDAMYGRGVASGLLKNAVVADWSKEPYIRGAYSYPIVGGGLSFRQDLSLPVQRKIYFSGEATHYGGHSGTVHGAMESSVRAVDELIRESK